METLCIARNFYWKKLMNVGDLVRNISPVGRRYDLIGIIVHVKSLAANYDECHVYWSNSNKVSYVASKYLEKV